MDEGVEIVARWGRGRVGGAVKWGRAAHVLVDKVAASLRRIMGGGGGEIGGILNGVDCSPCRLARFNNNKNYAHSSPK